MHNLLSEDSTFELAEELTGFDSKKKQIDDDQLSENFCTYID